MLSAVIESGIDLAAVWVYDRNANPNQTGEWKVTFENERAYQLRVIREVNDRLWSGDDEPP